MTGSRPTFKVRRGGTKVGHPLSFLRLSHLVPPFRKKKDTWSEGRESRRVCVYTNKSLWGEKGGTVGRIFYYQ
jgi:hypothetical protein